MCNIDKVVAEEPLQSLAAQINSEFKLLEAEERELINRTEQAMRRAKRIGELLTQAKSLQKHGEWERWLAENCSLSARQARQYMQFYSHWDEQVALDAVNETFSLEKMTNKFKEARMSSEALEAKRATKAAKAAKPPTKPVKPSEPKSHTEESLRLKRRTRLRWLQNL